MKIYTKTGDEGQTGLYGGPRVSKSSTRIAAYGSVDELNAVVGAVRSLLAEEIFRDLDEALSRLQNNLFVLGADLATPLEARVEIKRVRKEEAAAIECQIDLLEEELPELRQFILPTGVAAAAQFHIARTVCRRAERAVVELAASESINPECVRFLNRVSDYLFVAARWINLKSGRDDETWDSGS